MEEIVRDTSKILSGVNKLADTVLLTMGPEGGTVIITDFYGNPYVTKDGVSVANNITFKDPVENSAATLLKQAAQRTLEEAGDGTTTSICLAQSIINRGFKLLEEDKIYNEIKRDLQILEELVVEELFKVSRDLKHSEIYDVGLISSNNDPYIAALIQRAYDHSNIVKVEESNETRDNLETVSGMQLNGNLFDKAFINNGKKQAIDYNKTKLVIVDGKVNSIADIRGYIQGEQLLPIVIIADHFSTQVVDILKDQYNKNNIAIGLVKSPGFAGHRRDLMQDIIQYINASHGPITTIGSVAIVDRLFADKQKIIINKTDADVQGLVDELKEAVKIEKDPNSLKLLTERIGNLTGKISIIFAGGNSEVEMRERRDRIEDAVLAVRSALEEGVIEGGGFALARIALKIENSFQRCLFSPFKTINRDREIPEMDLGVDMFEQNIIDPAKVTRCALQNAISVAKTILSTKAVVLNERLWK